MDYLILSITLIAAFTLWLSAAWLDKKHQWRLLSWLNGQCENPFINPLHIEQGKQLNEKDQTIAQLQERIQVLEKIVTEPAYELNQKINQL